MEQPNITYKQDYPAIMQQKDFTTISNQAFHFPVQPPRYVTATPNLMQTQIYGNQVIQNQPPSIPQSVQQPLGQLWLLIEWDMPPGGPNSYAVIEASEMFCSNSVQPTRENIHTGKSILVKRGKRNLPATIVIISGPTIYPCLGLKI
jgi:hypothetical protein